MTKQLLYKLGKTTKVISFMNKRATFTGTESSNRKSSPGNVFRTVKKLTTVLTLNSIGGVKKHPFMDSIMSFKRNYLEVLKSIVAFISVKVMNKLRSVKLPFEMFFHNKSMFINRFFE